MNSQQIILEALKGFTDSLVFKDYNDTLILNQEIYQLDFILPQETNGVCIELLTLEMISKREESLQNDFVRFFEVNAPIIEGDKLMIKIDHHLAINLLPPFEAQNLPQRLTDVEFTTITRLLERNKKDPRFNDVKSSGMAIDCHWSYLYFEFSDQDRRFRLEKIEHKST